MAAAVQNLVASRLGRGFVPLAALFVVGIVELSVGAGLRVPVLSLGAIAAAGSMLAYGLRISQRALGLPHRSWMSWAMAGSLVPPSFALYVLGWRGLRLVATGEGPWPIGLGIAFAVMGTWVMRTWMKVVEVERLAKVMTMDMEG